MVEAAYNLQRTRKRLLPRLAVNCYELLLQKTSSSAHCLYVLLCLYNETYVVAQVGSWERVLKVGGGI